MKRVVRTLLAGTVTGLLTIGIAAPGAGAATASASCTKATNIEAIVDDSISMEFTDPDRLRVQAMNLLIDTLSPGTQLGAVEFGSAGYENNPPAADTVFSPQPVGSGASAMRTALDTKIHADNGATDYNGAFAQSDTDNPSADARIFLTDGGHDVDTYNEAHLVHNVRTYVIGFGGIADLVEATLDAAERRNATAEPQDIDEALAVDHMARSLAHELLPEIAAKSF